jgi:hypothetical protein
MRLAAMTMPLQLRTGGRKLKFAATGLVFALFLLFQTAAAAPAATVATAPAAAPAGTTLVVASGSVVYRVWHKIEIGLSDRRRMIQLATLGVCIGIYILMRRTW